MTFFNLNQYNRPPGKTCKTCMHRERWQCNSKGIQYCAIRTSKRTHNGLLKIKCKDAACVLYEELPFKGYSEGCEYCTCLQTAKANNSCERGAKLKYKKCGTLE